jgi:hypothetical protein
MLRVPSQEHCGQYGGVGRRDCVSVMVLVQPLLLLMMVSGAFSWEMAVAFWRARRRVRRRALAV